MNDEIVTLRIEYVLPRTVAERIYNDLQLVAESNFTTQGGKPRDLFYIELPPSVGVAPPKGD